MRGKTDVDESWWIAGLVLHGVHDRLRSSTGWLKPCLFWLALTVRLVFFHVPTSIVTTPMHWIWNTTGVRFAGMLPEKIKIPLGAMTVIAVILIGSFASPESADNTRDNRAVSLFGLAVVIVAMFITSKNRKAIKWHTVIVGKSNSDPSSLHFDADYMSRNVCAIYNCTLRSTIWGWL